MKNQKTITIVTILLLIALITLASFVGIYKREEYKVVNKTPKFKLGMEFTNRRLVNLQVPEKADDSKENIEYTQDDYIKAEKIIKERLKNLKVDEYKVSLDKSNGNIQIRIPENDETDEIIYYLTQSGSFELKDSKTNEVLIDSSTIQNAKVVYGQLETGTGIYVQIKFNKDGKQKLEEISKIYVKTTPENNSKEETSEDENTKKVAVYLNGEEHNETYFGQVLTDGVLNIIMGSASDNTTLQQYDKIAKNEAALLNSGILSIDYDETDSVEEYSMPRNQLNIALYIGLAVIIAMSIIYIVKFKTKGLFATALQIGFIALLLLTIRYASDVKITAQSICGIVLGIIFNYIYIYMAFKNIDLSFMKDTTLKLLKWIAPVAIIAIVLSFVSPLASINGIGKSLIISVILTYLYNLSLTQISINSIKK